MNDQDKAEAKFAKGSFASWKLDMLKAIGSDARLKASDVRVALVLFHHLNSSTWLLFPSHETLAELTHMSSRNVVTCLERLRDAGWLQWKRSTSRTESNDYEFLSDQLGEALANLKAEERARQARRSRPAKRAPDMKPSSGRAPISTRTPVHIPIRTTVHTNTYRDSLDAKQRAAK